jgi:hypothetical protein
MAKKKNTSKDIVSLGKHIAKERQKRGISLEQLATEMDISKGNLSDIENGKRDPRFSTLAAIAEGLDMGLAEMLQKY